MKLLLAAVLLLDVRPLNRPITRGHDQNPKEGPTVAWKAGLRLTLERREKEWVFVLQGTSTVPEEIRLLARVYAVESVPDPRQILRDDEEPLVWDDEDGQPAFARVETASGGFRTEVCRFARRPWSIRYRARLLYRPKDQAEDVLNRFGGDEWSLYTDLRVGTDASHAEELRVRLGESTADLLSLEEHFRDLCRRLDERADAEAWNAWKQDWRPRVDGIDARNAHRYGLWAVWAERQAKMRIGGLCELLRRLVALAEDEPAPEVLAEKIDHWRDYFEDGIHRIGVEPPLDAPSVDPLLRDYEIAFARLRRWVEEPAGEDVRREFRRDCLGALFRFVPLLERRKRAYAALNEVCVRLSRVLEIADAPVPASDPFAVGRALTTHDEAYQAFLRFRTLP